FPRRIVVLLAFRGIRAGTDIELVKRVHLPQGAAKGLGITVREDEPGTRPMGIIEEQRSRNTDDVAGGKFLVQLRPSRRTEVRAHFRSDAAAFVLIAST